MTSDLLIIGCGGFGREVVGIVDAINNSEPGRQVWNLVGFLDDSPSPQDKQRVAALGFSVLGPIESSALDDVSATSYVIGIGSGPARRAVSKRADSLGLNAITLIDPRAIIGRDVRIGAGTIIASGAHVTTNVTLGLHVHLDRAVQVGHDSTVGDFATVHPMAVLSGNCQVDSEAELGTSCTLLPGAAVGSGAIVGAGACVVNKVGEGQTVKGIPAR